MIAQYNVIGCGGGGSEGGGRNVRQNCEGQNANSIGICYIGGLAADGKTPKDTRTNMQKLALKALIEEIKASYPVATVHGHNEFANKACPCFDVKKEKY